MDPTKQRGFLNNNPGNMDRAAGEPWQGEIRDPADARITQFQRNELIAGRFAVFATPEYGIRAMVKNLQAYERAGWTTVDTMIDHWAPPPKKGLVAGSAGSEANGEDQNDTEAYKASVRKRLGVGPYDHVSMTDYATAYAMVDAITRVECGGMPYKGKEIEEGLRLAGVVKKPTVGNSKTLQGATTAGAAGVAQGLLQSVQDPIQNVLDTMSPLSDTLPYVQWAMVAGKVLLGAIALYGVYMIFRERKASAERDAMRAERDEAVATAQEAGL